MAEIETGSIIIITIIANGLIFSSGILLLWGLAKLFKLPDITLKFAIGCDLLASLLSLLPVLILTVVNYTKGELIGLSIIISFLLAEISILKYYINTSLSRIVTIAVLKMIIIFILSMLIFFLIGYKLIGI